MNVISRCGANQSAGDSDEPKMVQEGGRRMDRLLERSGPTHHIITQI